MMNIDVCCSYKYIIITIQSIDVMELVLAVSFFWL